MYITNKRPVALYLHFTALFFSIFVLHISLIHSLISQLQKVCSDQPSLFRCPFGMPHHPPVRFSASTRQAGLKPLQINRIRRGFEDLAEKKISGMLLQFLCSKFFHLTLFLLFVQLADSKGETKIDQTTIIKRVHHQYKYIYSFHFCILFYSK